MQNVVAGLVESAYFGGRGLNICGHGGGEPFALL